MITPTIVPNLYPIATIFQPNSNGEFESSLFSEIEAGGSKVSKLSQLFVNGLPHNPEFPLNELFEKY